MGNREAVNVSARTDADGRRAARRRAGDRRAAAGFCVTPGCVECGYAQPADLQTCGSCGGALAVPVLSRTGVYRHCGDGRRQGR